MLPARPRSTLLETPETYFVTRDQVDHIQQVILRTPNACDMSLTHIVMNRPGQPLSMFSPAFDGLSRFGQSQFVQYRDVHRGW